MRQLSFSDWITKKYIDWRGDAIGQQKSISEFSDMLGVPQSLMSQWMRSAGKIPTSQKYIDILLNRYGEEAWEALGFASKGPTSLYDGLPADFKSLVSEVRETIAEYKVSPDSPEADKVLDEIMRKRGYIRKEISEEPET